MPATSRNRDSHVQRAPTFGEYLAQARLAKGWSIREAARKAGLSETVWRQGESGFRWTEAKRQTPYVPEADSIRKIAEALGVSAEGLLRLAGRRTASDPPALEEGQATIVLPAGVPPEKVAEARRIVHALLSDYVK